jgi:uncharacterized protein (TIGR02147 family)
MPNIFEFFDFRKYLSEYYSDAKIAEDGFSYQSFTKKCGFKNKSFLHQVIHTSKKISKTSISGISKAIGHSKREARYFEALVAFNQARSLEEKNRCYDRLMAINARSKKPFRGKMVRKDQFEYYSKWYHGAIRAMIGMRPFKDDYKSIARNLYPPIPVWEVKKSIALLQRLQFIEKNDSGCYTVVDRIISTGDDVESTAVLNFHREAAQLAFEAADKIPREVRNLTGVMVGVSPAGYRKIVEKLNEFRKEILSIAGKDEQASAIYQLNLHLFPLSNPKPMIASLKKEKPL